MIINKKLFGNNNNEIEKSGFGNNMLKRNVRMVRMGNDSIIVERCIKKVKGIRPVGRSSSLSGVGSDDDDEYCIVKGKMGNVNNDVLGWKEVCLIILFNFCFVCAFVLVCRDLFFLFSSFKIFFFSFYFCLVVGEYLVGVVLLLVDL